MKKRGQAEVLQITLIFEFIVGVLIAGILIYAVMAINETSTVSEQYLKQDYSITKDVLQGKPGDYEITYPIGTFTVENNELKQQAGVNIKADNKAIIKKESGKIEITRG